MRILYIFLTCLFVSVQIQQVWGQCENGTNTNPNAPSPANAGFKTNTFNWRTLNPIPTNQKFGITSPEDIMNPFFTTNQGQYPLHGGLDSDSKPEDGWELIKQDFGYANANGVWNGQSIFNSTGGTYNNSVAYMMLYNRYTTTLRIIASIDHSNFPAGAGPQVIVRLRLKKKEIGVSNYANLNFAALFNQYQKVQTALDQKTVVTVVEAATQVQTNRKNFTFADFKLSYDPCICFFESAMEVEFLLKTTSTLSLVGRIQGGSVDVADKNATVQTDFLTSVFNNQFYNQTFYSEAQLNSRIAYAANKTTSDIDAAMKGIKNGVKIAKAVKAIPEAKKVAILKEAIGVASTILPYVEFASVVLDLAFPPAPKVQNPTIITAELAATGQLNGVTSLNGQNFLVGVPGSKNADILPEYPSSTLGGIKPMYPMYNELQGHFAVLRTPRLISGASIFGGVNTPYQGYELVCKIPDNIEYALGHLVDVENTTILVGIEIKKGSETYISQFLPIDQCKNLYAVTYLQPGVSVDINKDIKLVFQIFYSFKPDASNNKKGGYDLIKQAINNSVTMPRTVYQADPLYNLYKSAPTNLTMGATNYPNGGNVFSFGNITITGNITNTSSTPLIIVAQGDINIDPNVVLTGNIEIISGQLFPPWITPINSPMPPMSKSAIQSFCQSSSYKARDADPLMQEPTEAEVSTKTTTDNKKVQYNDLSISPNPFKEELRIQFELSETEQIRVFFTNTMGQVVQTAITGTRDKGLYEETINTQALAAGVYYLTLETSQGRKTVKVLKSDF